MAAAQILNHEYFHVLNTMNPCGQSEIIDRYVEEAQDYEAKSALLKSHTMRSKVIELLEGILNDGAMPLDVAFCQMIIILPRVQCHAASAVEFIAFFVYFLVGSCFPSLRRNITSICQYPVYQYRKSTLVRYLIETYFPSLNDIRCIKFKYSGNKATHVILAILALRPSFAITYNIHTMNLYIL
eukprot:1058663_1